MKLRFGTRGSRLAVVQSTEVADALRARGHEVELVTIRTSGDRLADVALADFGGKALFVKEIEEALLDGLWDGGVHSLKDMPAELPEGLCLAAFSARQDPRDVLLTRGGGTLDDLPRGARVATSSRYGATWIPGCGSSRRDSTTPWSWRERAWSGSASSQTMSRSSPPRS